MGFGDLKTEAGVSTLNGYLSDKSYIEGYQPSQADTVVFGALSAAPAQKFANARRWYNHISSYDSQRNSFPGPKKALDSYGGSAAAAQKADDDDDIDLFGSDDEADEDAEKLKAERIAAYTAKKANKTAVVAKKTAVVAKSNIVLDVKPWDDETDMKELEKCVRSVACDGLLWGASKLVPLAYGIKKLQICCVVEDDKVGTDFLEEEITNHEDLVQSVDIAAFNKI
ncbi:Elongation factor 1-beta [Lamellibrachia satsuma]|nr:Elongation factor 1-beta [Lamellibrachia satsuma]